MSAAIIGNVCPPRCAAGGKPEDDGHVWDVQIEFLSCRECGKDLFQEDADLTISPRNWPVVKQHYIDEGCDVRQARLTGGSVACRCGLSAMDRDLLRLP